MVHISVSLALIGVFIMTATASDVLRIEIVAGEGLSAARADEATRALLDELDSVRRGVATQVSVPAPADSKGLVEFIQEIVIPLGAAGALLPTFVKVAGDWIGRRLSNKIIIKNPIFGEIEISAGEPLEKVEATILRVLKEVTQPKQTET